MASSGRGISDAVRESIDAWVTDEVSSIIQAETKGTVSRWATRDSKHWVRRGRRGLPQGGYERDYECKHTNGRVGLRVHTDSSDSNIRYVTFRVDGRLVGGGRVNVPSTHLGNPGIASRRILFSQSGSTTVAPVKAPVPAFQPFTAAQLDKLRAKHEVSDAALESIFEDRE